MIPYQIMIEGVFLDAPVQVDSACGFHATFYLEANSAANAVQRVKAELQERLEAHRVHESKAHKAYFWVHGIWEITAEKYAANVGKDYGFSFFQIGRIEGVYLRMRRLFFLKFRPWLLVPLK